MILFATWNPTLRRKCSGLRRLLNLLVTSNRWARFCRLLACRPTVMTCWIPFLSPLMSRTRNARVSVTRRLLDRLTRLPRRLKWSWFARIRFPLRGSERYDILTFTLNERRTIVRLLYRTSVWPRPWITRLTYTRNQSTRRDSLKVLKL